MKHHKITYVVSGLLVVIFLLLMFVFQVRTTEVAVKTTFGKTTRVYKEPGAYFKWPWPIQRVYRFDNRIRNFEDQYEEARTQDGFNIISQLYLGWKVAEPKKFLNSFSDGSIEVAEDSLEGLLSGKKTTVVGQHPFSHFVSAEEAGLQLTNIESQILQAVKEPARKRYGISIDFLGVKRLGIPEQVTTNVFARMRAERQKAISRLNGQAEQEAMRIRSKAEARREEVLAEAEARATQIRGQADAVAAEQYQVFSQNPEFAELILKLNSLEESLKDRATLVLDQQTPPFDLLKGTKTPKGTSPKKPTKSEHDIAEQSE